MSQRGFARAKSFVRLVGDRAAVLLGTPGVASGLVAGAPDSEDQDRVCDKMSEEDI